MNKIMNDILLLLFKSNNNTNQRKISKQLNVSLGLVNKCINNLIKENYLDNDLNLTEKSLKKIKDGKTKSAIILAAGYGMRMVPINSLISKGLLEVKNEILIERLINQLHEVGIKDIKIVIGFMKEKYEYLIDKYNVILIVNTKYSERNNLYSLNLAKDYINNTYIVPCDIFCSVNPFSKNELYSWYMISNDLDGDSTIRVNKKFEIMKTHNNIGNRMVGIAYVSNEDKNEFIKQIVELNNKKEYRNSFWEEIFNHYNIIFKPNIVSNSDFFEINTYEDLRNCDYNSNSLNNEAINIIKNVFNVENFDITDIKELKKGMTNKSFLFKCKNENYIMRIPGEGTDKLINRKNEAAVYSKIKDKDICDDIYYINSNNGYKITKFLDNVRSCNPYDQNDLKKCMKKLREFHNLNLKVEHEFDIFNNIEFYESLWNGMPSIYDDYTVTKEKVLSLKQFIEANTKNKCLTHIDAVPDNFLINNNDGSVRLIDWEYAGMQDPCIDIAMFCIYSLYDKKKIDNLIDIYFENKCDKLTRIKIYAYISACGLLWSNWCEFKRILGVEFGEYSIKQYRYAKEYYKIVKEELGSVYIE